jgi:hypothetical protein
MSLSKLIFFVITLYCLVFITAAYSATFVTSEYHEKIPKKILVDHFEKRIDRTKKSITMQEFDLFIENGTVFFVSKKGPEKGKKQNLNQYFTFLDPQYILIETFFSKTTSTYAGVCIVDKVGFHCFAISWGNYAYTHYHFSKEWTAFGSDNFLMYLSESNHQVYAYLVSKKLETFKINLFNFPHDIKRVCLPDENEKCLPSQIVGSYEWKATPSNAVIRPTVPSYPTVNWVDGEVKYTEDILKVPKYGKFPETRTFQMAELERNTFLHGYYQKNSKENFGRFLFSPLFFLRNVGGEYIYNCIGTRDGATNGCLPINIALLDRNKFSKDFIEQEPFYVVSIEDKHVLLANLRNKTFINPYIRGFNENGTSYGHGCELKGKLGKSHLLYCGHLKNTNMGKHSFHQIEVLQNPLDVYQGKPKFEPFATEHDQLEILSADEFLIAQPGSVKLLKKTPIYIRGYKKWKR